MVVGRAVAVRQGKDEGGVGVGIGGVEVAHDGPRGTVLLRGEETSEQLRGGVVRVRGGVLRVSPRIHLGFVDVPVSIGVDVVRVGAQGEFGGIGQAVSVAVLVGVVQHHNGEWFFQCPVPLVVHSYSDCERRVGLVVQRVGRLQRAVCLQLEKVVVGRAVAVGEGKGEGGVGVGIGGVELAHDGPRGLVLLHGEKAGNELGGNVVRIGGGVLGVGAHIHLGLVVVSVSVGVRFVRVGA